MKMRVRGLKLNQICFVYQTYDQTLYDSIKRIGFSFPITVRKEDDQYICLDGHKRLSVLTDLLKEDPHYKRGDQVNVIIKNNGDERSNDCSRGRNTH